MKLQEIEGVDHLVQDNDKTMDCHIRRQTLHPKPKCNMICPEFKTFSVKDQLYVTLKCCNKTFKIEI